MKPQLRRLVEALSDIKSVVQVGGSLQHFFVYNVSICARTRLKYKGND